MSRSAHRTGHLIALDTTAAPPPDCALGCTSGGRHLPDCEDTDACAGCTPRPATDGQLCWTCYRRLQLMLTQAPAAQDWLHDNLARSTTSALRQDHERRRGGDDGSPEPIRLDILEHIETLRLELLGWVDVYVDHQNARGIRIQGPLNRLNRPITSTASAAGYLLRHLDHLVHYDFIDALWKGLAVEMATAHALAPWRATAQRIPDVPCPHCQKVALVLFGGEEDVTCTRCRTMIPPGRYGMWVRMLEAEHHSQLAAAEAERMAEPADALAS